MLRQAAGGRSGALTESARFFGRDALLHALRVARRLGRLALARLRALARRVVNAPVTQVRETGATGRCANKRIDQARAPAFSDATLKRRLACTKKYHLVVPKGESSALSERGERGTLGFAGVLASGARACSQVVHERVCECVRERVRTRTCMCMHASVR
eukprot:2298272-Pleurochrysis_carterae.AAC.1